MGVENEDSDSHLSSSQGYCAHITLIALDCIEIVCLLIYLSYILEFLHPGGLAAL